MTIPKKEHPNKAEKKSDRIILLKVKEGKKVIATSGLPDPRLFNGDNELHIYREPGTILWRIRYKNGGIPESLKQSFTTFDQALKLVTQYFDRRNVKVAGVID